MNERRPLESLTWTEFKAGQEYTVLTKNSPRLAAALDRLLATRHNESLLWRAEYEYGELIIEKGQFVLPEGAAPSEKEAFDKDFWKTFHETPGPSADGVRPCPFSLVLSRSVEVHMPQKTHDLGEHNIGNYPLQIIQEGDVFGVFEFLDRQTDVPMAPMDGYSISSGAQSIQIATTHKYYKKLWEGREEAIPSEYLNSENGEYKYSEVPHYHLIRQYSKEAGAGWSSAILLFPSRVMDEVAALGIKELLELLFKRGWIQATHTRRSALHTDERDKNIANHLSNLRSGYLPALVYSGFTGDISGPFDAVEKKMNVILKSTENCNHQVVIMSPWQLTTGQIGIYSFSKPQPFLGFSKGTKDLVYKDIAEAMAILAGDGKEAYSTHLCKALNIGAQVKAALLKKWEKSHAPAAAVSKAERLCRNDLTIDDLSWATTSPGVEGMSKLCVSMGVFSACIRVTGCHKHVNPFASGSEPNFSEAQPMGPSAL